MPKTTRVQLGKWGEDSACRELARQGYAILERRHRTRFGEIDIIANDRGVLVFVEVKARRTTTHGTAADALTCHKQRRLLRLALIYLAEKHLTNVPCRFDVVTVFLPTGARRAHVEVLKAAFDSRALS